MSFPIGVTLSICQLDDVHEQAIGEVLCQVSHGVTMSLQQQHILLYRSARISTYGREQLLHKLCP